MFEDGFGFERYAEWLVDQVPMYFVYRDGNYIDVAGSRFRDFMDGRLPALAGTQATVGDFADHMTTVFTDVRLKQFLEMRGADAGRPGHDAGAVGAVGRPAVRRRGAGRRRGAAARCRLERCGGDAGRGAAPGPRRESCPGGAATCATWPATWWPSPCDGLRARARRDPAKVGTNRSIWRPWRRSRRVHRPRRSIGWRASTGRGTAMCVKFSSKRRYERLS